jgi:hypothetical protein
MDKKIIAVILVVFSAFILFGCTQTDSAPANTNTGSNTSTSGVNDMTNQPSSSTGSGAKTMATNACEYFTLDLAKGVVSKDITQDPAISSSSTICSYIENVNKGKIVAFFMIVSSAFPPSGIDKQVSGAVGRGGEELSGIGERAWALNASTNSTEATVYLYKNEILAAVRINDGISFDDSKAKAVQLAKLVVAKLP